MRANPAGSTLLTLGLLLVAVGAATYLSVQVSGRETNPASRNSYVPMRLVGASRSAPRSAHPTIAQLPAFAPQDTSSHLELDPEAFDWEERFDERAPAALDTILADPSCRTFDAAVVMFLCDVYPDCGSFAMRPGMGTWKREARARARSFLQEALGPTEVQARARLCAVIGRAARERGASLDEAALAAAAAGWPEVRWSSDGCPLAWQHDALRSCRASIAA